MKKYIFFIAAILATYGCYYYRHNQPNKPADNNTLIVGTSADYPPYASIDMQTNEIVGFDIDIVTEIARRLDKKIIIKNMQFTALIFQLMYRQIDVIAAGLTPDDRRKKMVLFSRPYLDSDPLVIVTRQGDAPVSSVTDLCHKPTAVNLGYTSDIYLSKLPGMQLVRLNTPADAIMALQTKSVAAFVSAQSNLSCYLATQHNHAFQFFTIPNSGDSYALAFAKNNTTLYQQVDCVLDAMEKDGTLHTLKIKWEII